MEHSCESFQDLSTKDYRRTLPRDLQRARCKGPVKIFKPILRTLGDSGLIGFKAQGLGGFRGFLV